MPHLRQAVKVAADAVADEFFGNGESPLMSQSLHSASYFAQQPPVTAALDGRLEAVSSCSDQQFTDGVHVANREGVRGVAVVTAVEDADVNVYYVTVAQLRVVGDSVATDVVDGSAARFGKAPIPERRWESP